MGKYLYISDDIVWDDKERESVENRILNLKRDQIAALLNLAGLNFATKDIEIIVNEILEQQHSSDHLDLLMTENKSKENLLWWIVFFEKHN